MKVLCIVLVCAVAAVQGRSAAVESSRAAEAALGDMPSVVHLRLAVGTSGLLNTGAGSLVTDRWVLTSVNAIRGHSYIWVRLGAPKVINPQMVLETNAVTTNSAHSLALINLNRGVESTNYVAPLSPGGYLGQYGFFCAHGQQNERPGERLWCYEVSLNEHEGSIIGESTQAAIAPTDAGAGVFSDGQLTGLLIAADGSGRGEFVSIAEYVPWIENVTGADFSQ